jgi:iodotyrosine deiodinase
MDFDYDPIPLPHRFELTQAESRQRASDYYDLVKQRHSIRQFTDRPVPRDIIETCLRAAGTAPSGANHQPWHFVCVSDSATKLEIREAAEIEEAEFYGGKAGEEWLRDIKKIGTDAQKPFLEIAPWLIAIFVERYGTDDEGNRRKNYYTSESVGIATGFLLNALHVCGLSTLTHTPNPMKFLNKILGRPTSERPYMLLVVGYPSIDAKIPKAATVKKSLDQIASFFE